jgi:hypothetical protein
MLTSLRQAVPDACISDLTFDTWHAGELEAGRVNELERHLVDCERCRQRRESLERQVAKFLVEFPAPAARAPSRGDTLRRVVSLNAKRSARRWLASSALGLSAAAAVALLLRVSLRPRELGEETRFKGPSHVSFHVQHASSAEPGVDGQIVFPGDRLRFSITTAKPAHLAIFSLDGANVASVYFPPGDTSRHFDRVSRQPLESSVVLDDTLGRERLWALFCDREFALEPLRALLERDRELRVRAGCTVDEFSITKQSPP